MLGGVKFLGNFLIQLGGGPPNFSTNSFFSDKSEFFIYKPGLLDGVQLNYMEVPRVPKKTQSRVRLSRFVFTLNNYTEEEYSWLTEGWAQKVKWIIIAKEVGENGTPHLQGACIIGSQVSFSTLKTSIGFARAHIEPMRGRPEDSLAYCTKQDLHPFVCGILPAPGTRNDLRDATSVLLKGGSVQDLALSETHAPVVVKYYKGLTTLRSIIEQRRTLGKRDPPLVFWVYGPTGCGKTRCCFKAGRLLCKMWGQLDLSIWISSGGLRWFDGYDSQSVALFDDFRAKHVSSFAFFLRLLDRYPVKVEFKGGHVEWCPRVVFITCPRNPAETFEKVSQYRPEDINQLNRRITECFEFSANEKTKEGRSLFYSKIRAYFATSEGEPVGDGGEVDRV